MPIPLPNLDTRRWADLVAEARGLIPRHAPEWTDHNIHDPGITMIELLAWFIEQDIYLINRVPERHRRKFLRLLGDERRLVHPARVLLCFNLLEAGGPMIMGPGDLLAGTDQAIPFRLLGPVHVTTAGLGTALVLDDQGAEFEYPQTEAIEAFEIFGSDPNELGETGPALHLKFNPSPASDSATSLWFALTPMGTEAEADDHDHHDAQAVWELETESGWVALENCRDWPEPGQVRDDTRLFTRSGAVIFRPPQPAPPQPPGSGGDETAVLRCRLVTGRLDAAPRVERISLHAAEAIQIEPSIQASWIGTGEPGQTFSCEEGVFVPESLVIESGTAAGPQTWARIQDLDEAGPFEQAFVIDDHPCAIRLGDGRRGAVLPDSVTAAVEFNRTLGAEGSVKAETSWSIPAAKELNAAGDRILNCANPMPSEAGQDAETVDEALARIAQSLWAHERLVELAATEEAGSLDDLDPDSVLATEAPLRACTVLDYERLALNVPGTTVRRARAWVDYHADYPCLQAPGVVSLIILPELPTARPEPSSGLLWRVRNHLEERRTVGTQLRVFGPRYVTVGVAVRILRLDTTPEELVRTRVDDALRDFLHPLVGGPLGQGWPFGRDVYRSEVLALLDAVEGVDAVLALSMSTDRDDASCGNVCIAKEELVLSGDHAIEVES